MARKKPAKKKTARKASRKRTRRKKELEKRMGHFGEEVTRLGKKMEKRGKLWERRFYNTFGNFGPLISSILGILILSLFVSVLSVVNFYIGSPILSNISSFFLVNMGLFFLLFLFFAYASYFSKLYPRESKALSPIVIALGIIIALWIVAQIIGFVGMGMGVPVLSTIGFYMRGSLFWIFLFVALLGYIIVLTGAPSERPIREGKSIARKIPKASEVRRLYRSPKDKILGGVCGGIGEYLGLDPVLIRLLWIVGVFVWGAGILIYLIAWIIIPRDPRYRWVRG